MKKRDIFNITSTAVLMALLLVAQWGLGALTGGNQYVVGSAVNLILIIAAALFPAVSGITIAVISPLLAFMLGINPQLPLIPFIALGNLVLVLIWHFLVYKLKYSAKIMVAREIIATVIGSAVKAAVLYVGVTYVALPYLMSFPAQLSDAAIAAKKLVISTQFSFPQAITAAIGGVLAIAIIPVLAKATKNITSRT